MSVLLKVEDLKISFNVNGKKIRAVESSNFEVQTGETFSIVGESGSGKSVTALSIMQLLTKSNSSEISGKIFFKDKNILLMSEKELMEIRNKKYPSYFKNL